MASSLLDTIRNRLNAPESAPIAPQQEAIQGALNVGTTGKSTSSNIPKASNIGEQVANRQQQLGIQQVAQQGAIQSKQLEARNLDQEQQSAIQKSELEDRRIGVKAQMDSKTKEIMTNLSNSHRTMDGASRQVAMEQAAFLLRLNNDKYLEGLGQAGAKARLDNDVAFKEQLANDIFYGGEGLDGTKAFLESIYGPGGAQRAIDIDERKFNEEISAMSLDEALRIAKDAQKQEATKAQIQGISSLIGAGVQGYDANQQAQKDDKAAYREYSREQRSSGSSPESFSDFQSNKPEGY